MAPGRPGVCTARGGDGGDAEEGAGRAGLTEELPCELNLDGGQSLRSGDIWEQSQSPAFVGSGGPWQTVPWRPEEGRLRDRSTRHTAEVRSPILSQAQRRGVGSSREEVAPSLHSRRQGHVR